MNILRVLLPAYLAIAIGSAQYEEEFKITTGKKIRRGGPPNYGYHQLNSHIPYASPNYGVNPAYFPVVYGVRPTAFQQPQNTHLYPNYPFLQQNPQRYYPQQQVYGSNQNYPGFPIGSSKSDSVGYGYGKDRSGGYHIGGFLSPDFVDAINNAQNEWKAIPNFDDAPHIYDYVGDICGVRDPSVGKPNLLAPVSYNIKDIPAEFDARTYPPWAVCRSLFEVRDQGSCGSCWAISAVESMTDRICIRSGGKEQWHISTQDLLECCTSCGYGCDGGFPGIAWVYFKETGIVTGGEYNSTTPQERGCKPYEVPPCAHHTKRSTKKRCDSGVKTSECEKSCEDGRPYNEELHFGEIAYSVDKKVESIQLEIVNYGPVQASFEVYEDFVSYGSGVYSHVQGSKVGDHAVKIIGWGNENNTAYWLCVNSWGSDWGLLGGFVKIKRGTNECNIESNIIAGKPKVNTVNPSPSPEPAPSPPTPLPPISPPPSPPVPPPSPSPAPPPSPPPSPGPSPAPPPSPGPSPTPPSRGDIINQPTPLVDGNIPSPLRGNVINRQVPLVNGNIPPQLRGNIMNQRLPLVDANIPPPSRGNIINKPTPLVDGNIILPSRENILNHQTPLVDGNIPPSSRRNMMNQQAPLIDGDIQAPLFTDGQNIIYV